MRRRQLAKLCRGQVRVENDIISIVCSSTKKECSAGGRAILQLQDTAQLEVTPGLFPTHWQLLVTYQHSIRRPPKYSDHEISGIIIM